MNCTEQGAKSMSDIHPKKLVILYILDILQKYTDEEHRLSQKEIQNILKREYEMTVDRKAVKRNLLNLIEYGSNIEYREVSRKDIFRKKDSVSYKGTSDFADQEISEDDLLWTDFYLKQKFTNEELRLLIDSLLFSKHIPYSQAKELIKKLESLSNIYFKSCSQYIYPLPVERTDNKQVFYNIAILDDAIRKKKKVLFEYAEYHTDKKMHLKKREDGSVREYIITPYQMAVQEGKYYLICNYDKYDDISNYRVDRIRNIQILEEKGKPFETLKWSGHQPMNLNEYMKEHVYMYSSENAFVKFRIVKAMISDVIDLFGKGVNFSEETDTHVSVSVHVNERAAEQFAKNYAPDVVILQPKRLRDKLRDDLKKAWEAYED
jgi:predicted DNA-binding transcriptional regulator YafY